MSRRVSLIRVVFKNFVVVPWDVMIWGFCCGGWKFFLFCRGKFYVLLYEWVLKVVLVSHPIVYSLGFSLLIIAFSLYPNFSEIIKNKNSLV